VIASIIGADNQFGKDFGHPNPGLQGTILAMYEVRKYLRTCPFPDLTHAFTVTHWRVCWISGHRALGRRRTIFRGTIVQIIGTIIQVTTWNVPQIVVGRVVTGIDWWCSDFDYSDLPDRDMPAQESWESSCYWLHNYSDWSRDGILVG
jgi:hypothetical protein